MSVIFFQIIKKNCLIKQKTQTEIFFWHYDSIADSFNSIFIRLMVQWRENVDTMANTSLSWVPEASRPRNRLVNNICFTIVMTEQLWLSWLHISYFLCSFASLCYFLCHQINRMNNFLRRLSTPWAALGSLVKLGFTLSFVHKRYSLGKISSQKTMAKAMDCL